MSTYTIKAKALNILSHAAPFALAVVLVVSALTVNGGARAEMASINDALSEMSIGSPDAPVTLHEYSSLTCGHCANFHVNTLPEIKKNYVDTGKVRIVFHDFPLDNLALAAAMIARCAGPKRHFELFDRLYHAQDSWARSDKPRAALVSIARFSGLSIEDVDQCLRSEELAQGIQSTSQNAQDLYAISSTPTFILEGKKIQGAMAFDDFKDELDKALSAKGAN
ncbi:DsbA family protein [Magnetovibrio sp.]|uniref:DsbA family protein n=1 Tax=Magnetovibrio sp. TaxID=2024836 RepID=UPI002F9359CA